MRVCVRACVGKPREVWADGVEVTSFDPLLHNEPDKHSRIQAAIQKTSTPWEGWGDEGVWEEAGRGEGVGGCCWTSPLQRIHSISLSLKDFSEFP